MPTSSLSIFIRITRPGCVLLMALGLLSAGCQSYTVADSHEEAVVYAIAAQPGAAGAQARPATAEAVMVYWPGHRDAQQRDMMAAELHGAETLLQTELYTLTSRLVLERMLIQPVVVDTDWFQPYRGDIESAMHDLRQMLAAERIPDTLLIRLTATADDGIDAQMILIEWIKVYRRATETRSEARATRDRIAYQRQYENVQGQVALYEAQIRRLLLDHPYASLELSALGLAELQVLLRGEGENDDDPPQPGVLDAAFFDQLADLLQAREDYLTLARELRLLEVRRDDARRSLGKLDRFIRLGAYDNGFQLLEPAALVEP